MPPRRLRLLHSACLALVLAACGDARPAADEAGQAAAGLANLPPDALVLQKVVIEDPGVIARGPALTALIPAGWQARGGVAAPAGACSEPYVVDWHAQSADRLSGMGIFPTEAWQWSTFPMQSACARRVVRSARDYLAGKAQELFPGARVLAHRERPDLARAAQQNAERLMQMARSMGLDGMQARGEGAEVQISFERDGQAMQGVIAVTALFQGSVLRNPLDGSMMEAVTGSTLGTFLAYAPEGRLDLDLVEATRRSVTPQVPWLRQLFALQGEIGRINAQATSERAAIIVAGGAEATRRNIAAHEQVARNAVQNSRDSIAAGERPGAASREEGVFPGDAAGDGAQRERIELIRGVETYHDPVDGSNVQLDATYEHAWRVSGQDAYILTRDPNFDPGAYGVEATQLGVVR
jgi:hypothetical protein